MQHKNKITIIASSVLLLFQSCATKPKGAEPVSPFDSVKYLGTWYEIARLDFKFERGLNNTTANYSMREDGKIKVLNKGYRYAESKWEESVGKAKFSGDANVGALKVSFFGPFYASYNVIDIDPEYKYALVVGKNTKYMWILSRTKYIPNDIRDRFLAKSKSLGYNNSDLIWVEHNE